MAGTPPVPKLQCISHSSDRAWCASIARRQSSFRGKRPLARHCVNGSIRNPHESRLRSAPRICCAQYCRACGDGESGAPSPSSSTSAVSSPGHAVSGSAESVQVGPETEVFDSPLPRSPAEAKVIQDFRKAQVLWDESDTAQRLVAPVTDYVTGEALLHLREAVAAARKYDLVPAGKDRMFKTRVTILTARSATVATCDDASKLREKNRHTGKIDAQLVAPPISSTCS